MKGQSILITGAAGGLGSALARKLSELEADLLLIDRNIAALEALSDSLVDKGLREPGICEMDLARAGTPEYRELANLLESEFGGLDIFIHCAAEFDGLRPLGQVSESYWDTCIKVNALSAWHIVRSSLQMLRKGRKGRVVLIGEADGVSRSAYWGPYGVSKAALKSLAQIMSQELEGTGAKLLWAVPRPMSTELRARAYLSEDPFTLSPPAREADEVIRLLEESLADD